MKSIGNSALRFSREKFKDQLDEYIELDVKYFPFPWSVESWNESLGQKEYEVWALRDDHKLVGFILYQLFALDERLELLKICLKDSYRSKGLGQKILRDSIDYYKNQGFSSCMLEVSVNNTSALKAYKFFGFESLRRIRSFYSSGEDAFSMELKMK